MSSDTLQTTCTQSFSYVVYRANGADTWPRLHKKRQTKHYGYFYGKDDVHDDSCSSGDDKIDVQLMTLL